MCAELCTVKYKYLGLARYKIAFTLEENRSNKQIQCVIWDQCMVQLSVQLKAQLTERLGS